MAAVVGTGVLLGCSAPPEAAPAARLSPADVTEMASPTPSPTPSPTRAPIDTASVPDDINAEYVQAVMDDLDEALGNIYRQVRSSGKTGEAYHAGMRSIYSTQAASDLARAFRRSVGVKGLARRPRNPKTVVLEVLQATPTCVYFTAERDLNPMLRAPIDPVQPYYLALGRSKPTDRNPTAWILHMDTYFRDGSAPKAVCEVGT